MQRFTQLRVWQQGHRLALAVYRATALFPVDERFGLTSQLRRAALSVPTNIVEGSKRISRQDYARFLNMAEASLAEAEYLLRIARDLGYVTSPACAPLLSEARELARRLHVLRAKVEP